MYTRLLIPKPDEAELLGWAFVLQNPSLPTTFDKVAFYQTNRKNQLLVPNKRYWFQVLLASV